MKLNGNGEVLWSKAIGGSGTEQLFKIKSTSDGGYIAVGLTHSYGISVDGVAWMVKTDANGNVEWAKIYDDGNRYGSVAYNVIQTSEGGYTICGTNNNAQFYPDAMIIKTDNQGNVQWAKNFNNTDNYQARGLIESDGSLIVSSIQHSPTTTYYDGVVMKLNITNGSVIWARQYDIGGKNNNFDEIYKTNNGFALFSLDFDNFSVGSNLATTILQMDKTGAPVKLIKVSLANPSGIGHGASALTKDDGYVVS